MTIFKDKYAQVGRVKPISQLALPISDTRRKLRFVFDGRFFKFSGKRVTKEDARNLAKWILSHD